MPAKLDRWLGLIPVGLVFVFMCWISWGKWPDLIIDFGLQLYIPWQLSEGSVLYRDIAYLPGGPVSQYLNATIFKIFGASLQTIAIINLVILGLLIFGIYRTFLNLSNWLMAVTLALAVTIMFGFAQITDLSNYTYVCPYSHEAVHGGVLGLVVATLLARWMLERSILPVCGTGFALGIIFMTKAEIFTAVAIVVTAAFALQFRQRSTGELLRCAAVMAGCALIVPALFLFYFARFRTLGESVQSVCGAWMPLLTSNVADNAYYRWCMGLDTPWFFVREMFIHFITFGAGMAFLIWRYKSKTTSVERIVLLTLIGAAALAFNWANVASSLGLLIVGVIAALGWRYKNAVAERPTLTLPLLWAVYGLFLLAKMGLNPRIWHYGFVLALPAFIVAAYFFIWLLPEWLEQYSVQKTFLRGTLLCFLAVGIFRIAGTSCSNYMQRNYPVGSGADRFHVVNPQESFASEAAVHVLDWIGTNVAPHETLAALPEGAMFNYLARRSNSTPYLVFMAEVSAFGEEKMFAAYRANPPDYILLVHRDSSQYGVRFFGWQGMGFEMMKWIEANYEPVFLVGSEPLQTDDFGMKVLRRSHKAVTSSSGRKVL